MKKKILSRNSLDISAPGAAGSLSGIGQAVSSRHHQSILVNANNPSPKPNLKRKRAAVPTRDQRQRQPPHKHCRHSDLTSSESIASQPPLPPEPTKKPPASHISSQRRASLRQSANARNLSSRTAATLSPALSLATAIATTITNGNSTESQQHNSLNRPPPLLLPRLSLEDTLEVGDGDRLGKLTIKLRKTADHPNRYEHCLTAPQPPPLLLPLVSIKKLSLPKKPKLQQQYHHHHNNSRDTDSNIFSRMTQLYLSRPLDSATTPPQSDTPPFLSPWFCSEKSSSHSSRKSKTTTKSKWKSKTQSKQREPQLMMQQQPLYQHQQQPKKNHLRIVNLNTRPTIHNCYDNNNSASNNNTNHNRRNSGSNFECCFLTAAAAANAAFAGPETSTSSDIPSYSASSPTIPILEIESETELVPPQLVCELQESPPLPGHHRQMRQPADEVVADATSPSRSKGIVMRFSRICGNRFISLLS